MFYFNIKRRTINFVSTDLVLVLFSPCKVKTASLALWKTIIVLFRNNENNYFVFLLPEPFDSR